MSSTTPNGQHYKIDLQNNNNNNDTIALNNDNNNETSVVADKSTVYKNLVSI